MLAGAALLRNSNGGRLASGGRGTALTCAKPCAQRLASISSSAISRLAQRNHHSSPKDADGLSARRHRPSLTSVDRCPVCPSQRRGYRLLPSQTFSLVQEFIPAALGGHGGTGSGSDIRLASTVEDVRQAVRALPHYPIALQADILDPIPEQGGFSIDDTASGGLVSHVLARGATQIVWNEDDAVTLAKLWLDQTTNFQSAAQPYIAKRTPCLIVRLAAGASAHKDQASATSPTKSVRFKLSADRRAHGGKSGKCGVFFGPSLTIIVTPSSVSSGLSHQLEPSHSMVMGIDVTTLAHAKTNGEVAALGTENADTGMDKALNKVAERAAAAAWSQQSAHIGLTEGAQSACKSIVEQMVATYWRSDGDCFVIDMLMPSQAECSAHLVAAEMRFDDDSLARQPHLKAMRENGSYMWGKSETTDWQASPVNAVQHELHELEEIGEKSGMVYRKHAGGNVGLFGYGAGMGMGTVDGLVEEGGTPANFFDGGGGASIENSKEAMRILSMDSDVKCILINIFGGITRSDLVAKGVVEAYKEYNIELPLVARFRGNKAQEAQETLCKSGLKVELFDDYRPAARRAREIAESQKPELPASRMSSGQIRSHPALSRPLPGVQKRTLATSTRHSQSGAVQALVGYAFAGKPRIPETQDGSGSTSNTTPPAPASLPRQGFPSQSAIGEWVDKMLKNGEAGEDALVVSPMKGKGDWILGVADGVGGWSENGIDPALFSQALMYHAADYAQRFFACPQHLEAEELASDQSESPLSTPPPSPSPSNPASSAEPGTPLDILQYAYQETLTQKEVPAGSATACIVTFDSSKGMLRSANLGDSGLIVLRPSSKTSTGNLGEQVSQAAAGKSSADDDAANEGSNNQHVVHYQSKPQTHGFNTPLQLSKLPPEFRFDGSIDSQPHHAAIWNAPVRDGDIVLLASDGFWDNVSTAEVLQLVAFIRQKHRAAWAEQRDDPSAAPNDNVAEERDLANVLAHK